MASPANGTPLPQYIDPAGLQAIIQYLTAFEAHLREPEVNPEPPLALIFTHSAHGCIHAIYGVPYSEDYPMMGVSLGGDWLHPARPLDCIALRLMVAFGLPLTDEHLDHGMERWAARAVALEYFDGHAAGYPVSITREQYANMLDLAFGLGDRAYGTKDEEGRLFQDTLDHSGEVAQ